MFAKVLIANRGAIAARICRTLDAMGVASVAVHAEADRDSLHLHAASEALSLGDGGVADTYLNVEALLEAVERSGADAVHPGYGFLSENAAFAQTLEERGVAFIGPRPGQLRQFGLKHEARKLAEAAGVALLPGSGVLANADAALAEAERIGYPVMLKSSAGGGGIGMRRCADAAELKAAFRDTERLAQAQFGDARVFVERLVTRARHVEVQAFGDGRGEVLTIGERDCSMQRRNQKVIEECPAPNLPDAARERMAEQARALLAQVRYRSAGTVEFLYDEERGEASFLEVNTRLQVEHGVTEMVFGVDIVQWMVALAAGELPPLAELGRDLAPTGHAIQARLYAEDPQRGFRPSPGRAAAVRFPAGEGLRVDTWLRPGARVPAQFDPLLAKIIRWGEDRDAARRGLLTALRETVVGGVETNARYLGAALADAEFAAGAATTDTLARVSSDAPTVEVEEAGAHTTIQAFPGRQGYWAVGVPPSGPMDSLSFRLGNRMLGNDEGAPGLEITVRGPTLRFFAPALVALAGSAPLARNGEPQPAWTAMAVAAGDTLAVGAVSDGARAYLLFAGGLDVTETLGSAATFTLGGIGGMNGRDLRVGDVLHLGAPARPPRARSLDASQQPPLTDRHHLHVTLGPHCTEEFLQPGAVDSLLAADWTVHYHSNRTGVRLIGPRPAWARADGGEAGLHPSNIHDTAYAIGAVDFTGDMPVILGPDGPSLGGFVCPAAVVEADLWKLGQLAAGDRVRLKAVSERQARRLQDEQDTRIRTLGTQSPAKPHSQREPAVVLDAGGGTADRVQFRRAGQSWLLVEFGAPVLDIEQRLRVYGLQAAIAEAALPGVRELTPGVRSLQVRFDSSVWDTRRLTERLAPLLDAAPATAVPSRMVHLPLSWDDPACREAVDRYARSVRPDAPWCPDNVEFIRRINGLADADAVRTIVFDASYLVLGLGDVYLGAPVATPVDPRHRLVTTKYNPARTWTAENSVGIGGSYLCIYGMEGPGGYQFVGRTIQVWDTYRQGLPFDEHWLLRPFDRIRFFPVDAAELAEMREAFPRGGMDIRIEEGVFDIAEHRARLRTHADEIAAFQATRERAFAAELADWKARGLLNFDAEQAPAPAAAAAPTRPFVASPLAGSVWAVHVEPGQAVNQDDVLFVVESMKAEFPVTAPRAGVIDEVLVSRGQVVEAGQALASGG